MRRAGILATRCRGWSWRRGTSFVERSTTRWWAVETGDACRSSGRRGLSRATVVRGTERFAWWRRGWWRAASWRPAVEPAAADDRAGGGHVAGKRGRLLRRTPAVDGSCARRPRTGCVRRLPSSTAKAGDVDLVQRAADASRTFEPATDEPRAAIAVRESGAALRLRAKRRLNDRERGPNGPVTSAIRLHPIAARRRRSVTSGRSFWGADPTREAAQLRLFLSNSAAVPLAGRSVILAQRTAVDDAMQCRVHRRS